MTRAPSGSHTTGAASTVRGVLVAGVACVLLLAASGCQTTGGGDAPNSDHTTRVIPFQPTSAKSGLHLDKGRYPDLFASTSYACWAGADANAPASEQAESMAGTLGGRFAVVECRVESAFSDMDKAYEVVGLRGIDAYLLTESGRKIRPSKIVHGQALDETPVGALRHFGRTNLLIFPLDGIQTVVSGVEPKPPVLRLVLEGYDSSFYFVWTSFVPAPAPERYPELKSRLRTTQRNLQTASRRFIEVSHRFD